MRGLDRAHHVEVATLGALCLGSRAVEGLGEDAGLQRRVDLAADGGALPGVRFVLVLHVGHEVPVDVIQRGIREGVVVVAHVVFLRRRRGESVLHEGLVEGLVPRRYELGPELVRGHPVLTLGVIGALLAVHRPGVVLSPEADEARGDVTDAGVAVVLLAQGVHEVQEHLLDRRVVVVRGEGDVVVVEDRVGARRVDARVDEVLGDAGFTRGVVEVEADRRLVAARRDGVEERIDLREVVGVAPGYDGVDGEVCPLHRVGECPLDGLGGGAVLRCEGEEALKGVHDRSVGRFERRPLDGVILRRRGRQCCACHACSGRQSHGNSGKTSHR